MHKTNTCKAQRYKNKTNILPIFATVYIILLPDVFDYANLALIKLTQEEPIKNVVCLPKSSEDDWTRLREGAEITDCVATGYGVTGKQNNNFSKYWISDCG